MRLLPVLALALAASSVPAFAQEATPTVAVRVGQTLRDVNMSRIGVVDRVRDDGSVRVIYNSKFVTIPADKISVADGVVKTTLTKKEVGKL